MKMKVMFDANVCNNEDDNSLLIELNINSPEQDNFVSTDVILVIDESYSMTSQASIKEDAIIGEEDGLCILDIVKHATKTVINILDDNDRVAIVGFSDNARIVLPLTSMDETGKTNAIRQTDNINVKGSTNIWDGLKTAIDIFQRDNNNTGRYKTILLLTDGIPNVRPNNGDHIKTLTDYMNINKCNGNFTINTFGFGYNLDSRLLYDLAITGSGMYSFIPDASFVGTSFVNNISNIKVTNIIDITMEFKNIQPERCELLSSNSKLGTGQNQQRRSTILKIKDCNIEQCPDVEVILSYNTNKYRIENNYYIKEYIDYSSSSDEVLYNYVRLMFVKTINTIMNYERYNHYQFNICLTDFITLTKIISQRVHNKEFIENLLKDAKGQVMEAISKEIWFNKWGRHYLPSLSMAHDRQQCNNFKDPGVQMYGGELFETMRDKADDIFLTIPPPVPTTRQVDYRHYGYYPNANQATVNMARFHSSSNPCFHGDCNIKMSNNTNKKVRELRKGDKVYCPFGYSNIICIVKTRCERARTYLVEHNGLLITPYHPVLNNDGVWEFPLNIGLIDEYDCDYVYSIVLQNNHIVEIEGTICVTMGHDFQNNEVVRHPFFGSLKVINELKKKKGWKKGLIELEPNCIIKDPITKMACGFV